jgi:hypothetical protein
MWWIAVGLGAFAAVIHWCIRERPVPRLAMAATPARVLSARASETAALHGSPGTRAPSR